MACKICGASEGGVIASGSPADEKEGAAGAPEGATAAAPGEAAVSPAASIGPSCPRCGYPAVKEGAARALAEAAALSGRAPADAVIRRIQQAVKADPDAWLARLRLASAYERKAGEGQPALLRLAQKEIADALRIAPAEREVHAARIGIAARIGSLSLIKAEYEGRKDDPVAREALRMVEAVERSAAVPAAVPSGLPRPVRFKIMLVGAIVTGLLGVGETVMMMMPVGDSTMGGGMDFPLAVVFVTAAVIMGLEAYRSRKGKNQE